MQGTCCQRVQNVIQAVLLSALLLIVVASQALALDAIIVPENIDALDLTSSVDIYPNASKSIQVSTAPDSDGIVRRIEVRSIDDTASSWAVFALSNPGEEQIDRLLVAPYYKMTGGGVLAPDLASAVLFH